MNTTPDDAAARLADGDSGGFYADDVPFRSGIVQQQSPLNMALVAALNGYAPPAPRGHFRYCDLGCGDGTTLCAFAATWPEAEFVGIDFNPGHIADARAQAEAAGLTNVRFIQASFAEALDLDLPVFDFIGMNGIYAWLERDLTAAVQDILRRHLRPGGLFYVEYMTMPGMVAVVPLWQLLQSAVPDTGRDSRDRATGALRILDQLAGGGMAYLSRHPTARNAAQSYLKSWHDDPSRVDHFAHNALASGFRPRYVTEMAEEMADAGLTFAGRTETRLNDPELTVPVKQLGVLRGVEDRLTRELLVDFIRNERNRRDVFVKDGEPDADGARHFLTNDVGFLLRPRPENASRALALPGDRELPLTAPGYEELIQGFADVGRSVAAVEMPEPVRADLLITAAHRLFATGEYFLCAPGVEARPRPEEPPERVHIADRVNGARLDSQVERFLGGPVIAPRMGGPVIQLGPVELAALVAWCEVGWSNAAARLRQLLTGRTAQIKVQGTAHRVCDLDETQLTELVLRPLADGKAANMLRLGILEADA